jgi:hypothetical protein
MPEGLDKLAAVVDKVQSSQVDSLITQLSSRDLK